MREHQELVFISVGGMVQRTAAGGISQQGRSATGVRVMNLKDEDVVSAVALVVDTGEDASRRRTATRRAPTARQSSRPTQQPTSDAAHEAVVRVTRLALDPPTSRFTARSESYERRPTG